MEATHQVLETTNPPVLETTDSVLEMNASSVSYDDNASGPSGAKPSPLLPVIQILFCSFTLIFNILVLVVISTSKEMFKTTYYFLGHLAVSDLLFGITFVIRFCIVNMPLSIMTVDLCVLTLGTMATSIGTSAAGILFLALQTYLAVRKSHTLEKAITARTATVMILASWIFFMFIGALCKFFATTPDLPSQYGLVCFVGSKYINRGYPTLLAISFFAMYLPALFFQVVTLKTLFVRQRQINPILRAHEETHTTNSQHVPSGSSRQARMSNHESHPKTRSAQGTHGIHRESSLDEQTVSSVISTDFRRRKNLAIKHRNGLIIVMAILVMFTICLCPIMFGLILFGVCPDGCGLTDRKLRSLVTFAFIQSFSNCIIYIVRDRSFRQRAKRLFCCK